MRKREAIARLLVIFIVSASGIGIGWWLLSPKLTLVSPGTAGLSDTELAEGILIEAENLPPLWGPSLIETDRLSVPDGVGISRWFAQSPSRTWVNVLEDVFVLPDVSRAEQYYEIQLEEYGKLDFQGWESMPELQFPHSADDSHIACHEAYVNGYHHFGCYVIMRYERVVIVVGGHIFDRRWLTAEQFRYVLIEADARVLEYLNSTE